MKSGIIRYAIVFVVVGMIFACNRAETATEKRANENARLSTYIADSGYVIVYTDPDTGAWVTADGHDIYYQTPTGLLFHQEIAGAPNGKKPVYGSGVSGSKVSIKYELTTLESDSIIETNELGQPFQFYVGGTGTITGMSEAVYLMKEGEVARVIMPSILAYNSYGSGDGSIAPYQTIIYRIHLLDVR